jgi:hypothetical protein
MDYQYGISFNEDGVPVSHHVCSACGYYFTVTPAMDPEQWGGSICLTKPCPSYDPERDVDELFDVTV